VPISTDLIETPTFTEIDRRMLARALELASHGVGQVSPGPLVGCVITNGADEIVGEGFYLFEEVKHAETVALLQAGEKARGGTAYVSLEPHAHHGRTPPCTDSLIAAGVKRVVAPIQDLNPKVLGRGFEHLRASGIAVDTGLLAREAEQLNEKYLHLMRTRRPFVHLKLAVSLDGKIATRTGNSRWVAGPEALQRAHEIRHECDAILVGANTVKVDDPLLTDRSDRKRRKPLVRVVLDDRLEISVHSNLVRTALELPLLIFTRAQSAQDKRAQLQEAGAEIITTTGPRGVGTVLDELAARSLQSVLVEGGGVVAGQFFDEELVDKATFFIAPKIVGGQSAPTAVGGLGVEDMSQAWSLERISITQRGADLEITGYPIKGAGINAQ
jgi:diaminohydroxyphosphoribosylaminopyrimidine deaminase / 5-amino-6-(5-phosphoribosylamino)uracil reductase